jgi:hypothetical protein
VPDLGCPYEDPQLRRRVGRTTSNSAEDSPPDTAGNHNHRARSPLTLPQIVCRCLR